MPFTTGIELEFNCANDATVAAFTRQGWMIKSDSSCGRETVSPILSDYDALSKQVAQICQAAASDPMFSCDTRCGFHVHVGMQDTADLAFKYRLLRLCAHFETAIFSLADTHRRELHYCARFPREFIEKMSTGHGWGSWSTRYLWVNGVNMARQTPDKTTVEFRLMAGTFKPDQITGWVCFVQVLALFVKATRTRFSWDDTGTLAELNDKVLNYEVEGYADVYATARAWFAARTSATE